MAGVYFDDMTVGQVFKHPIRRTITEADNVWFTCLTHNPAYLHLDEEYCKEHSEFGQRIVNGIEESPLPALQHAPGAWHVSGGQSPGRVHERSGEAKRCVEQDIFSDGASCSCLRR